MPVWTLSVLVLHIISGYLSLLYGTAVMVLRKGTPRHRWLGRVFFYSLLGVTASSVVLAVVLAVVHDIPFLFFIGIFVFYQNHTGFRALQQRTAPPTLADGLVSLLGLVNGIGMVRSGEVVLTVFGGISIFLAGSDFWRYYGLYRGRGPRKLDWLARHIGMMVGAYIGTVTAFLVVNVKAGGPAWMVWLLPTAVMVPLMRFWVWKYTRKPFRKAVPAVAAVVLLGTFCQPAAAQPYIEGGNTRHRFAQLTLGADTRVFLPSGSKTRVPDASGISEDVPLGAQSETRLIVSGTHFWGHADFYVAFPVASVGKSGFGTGAETGARVFPWRIEDGKLRPFVGAAWLPTTYQQGDGVSQTRRSFPVTAGMVFNSGRNLFEIGGGYNYQNTRTYYIGPTQAATVQTQPFWISAGYKVMLGPSVGAEKDWQSGRTKALTDTLGKTGRLDGFTLAVGPSSAMFLKGSSHNRSALPYLDDHKIARIFPEFGAGYYFHWPDVQLNVAYRSIHSRLDAYGTSQVASRKALTFEAYKFFADYHGFVPFVGPAVSRERLSVRERTAAGGDERFEFSGWKPGLTFGWDIRPDRLQSWYLRTNLRWFPNMGIGMGDGKEVAFDGLEFNFIELVVLPGRMF